jgi:hypothetical protein
MMGPPPAMMTRPERQTEIESVSDIVSVDEGGPDTREVHLGEEEEARAEE